jgi:hypothetical protein
MEAIQTKYLGATNCLGSRIKAFDCNGNSVTIPYRPENSSGDAHILAAWTLAQKMRWPQIGWIGSGTKDGMVFVHENSTTRF